MATKTEPVTLPSDEVREAEETEEVNHIVCFLCENLNATFYTTVCGQAVDPSEEAGPHEYPACKPCVATIPAHRMEYH